MSFAEEYIAQLERFAARSALPRVRALHLPPKYVPGVGNQGEFCALELEDGSLGLAFVLLGDTLEQLRAEREGYGLAGADCLPDALFARGVTLVGGSWVRDRGGFLEALCRGEPHSRHTRKYAIAAAGYPGFEQPLARV